MGSSMDEGLFDPTFNRGVNSTLSKHRQDLKALETIKRGLELKLARVNRHIEGKKQTIKTTVQEAKEFKRLMLSEDT